MTTRRRSPAARERGLRQKRDLAEKGWVPLRYWVLWWTLIGIADVVFYVVLTPIWVGLRAVAWLAELRSRVRRRGSSPDRHDRA